MTITFSSFQPQKVQLQLREGSEKIRELEEIMNGSGAFNENFSLGLGDFMEIEDQEASAQTPEAQGKSGAPKGLKRKADPFPCVDGEEACTDYIAKYKKACLNRKGVFRELQEKWDGMQLKGAKQLD